MSNSILTIDMISRKSLDILENKLVITRNANRDYDNSFAQKGAKIGDSARVRLPDRCTVSDGAALQTQDENEQSVTIRLNSQKHVGINFTTAELALSMDDFAERILKPRMSQLAASVDADVANVYKEFGNSVGTPGTTPATSLVLLQGSQKLNENAVDESMRYAAVNPAANAALVNGMTGLFNPQTNIANQFRSGVMGNNILGLDEINMSQSVKVHTCGSRTATGGTTSAAVTTEGATSIAITGAGAFATVRTGDVFTVADCFAVNPQTRETTGSLYQLVAKADVTLNASGAGTITVDPIYSASQALATVDVLPGNAKAVVFLGAASGQFAQNLIYHKDAITFATADLVLPQGVDMASRQNYNGISLRIVRQYDINNDRMPCRVDVLYGYKVTRREAGVRLWG